MGIYHSDMARMCICGSYSRSVYESEDVSRGPLVHYYSTPMLYQVLAVKRSR
jgi:hypothetical protein